MSNKDGRYGRYRASRIPLQKHIFVRIASFCTCSTSPATSCICHDTQLGNNTKFYTNGAVSGLLNFTQRVQKMKMITF